MYCKAISPQIMARLQNVSAHATHAPHLTRMDFQTAMQLCVLAVAMKNGNGFP